MKENEIFTAYKRVYELDETPFWLETLGYRFYFSSDYNRQNFKKRIHPRKEKMLTRLLAYVPNRSKDNLKGADKLNAINTYHSIEKKGFKILNINNREVYKCPNEIIVVVSLQE